MLKVIISSPLLLTKHMMKRRHCFLVAFAGSYRQISGQLQATRVGRDQKVFRNGQKQITKKRKKFFTPGQPPKRPDRGRRTLFKDKVSGKQHRGSSTDLTKRVTCYRCGKEGHMSKHCTEEPLPTWRDKRVLPAKKKSFFQFHDHANPT